jgi:hypothetical protein
MKVTFTPAPLQAQTFPAGTDGSGALKVLLVIGASFSQAQGCDGTSDVVFTGVPEDTGMLTYGRRKADDSDWLGTPFTVPVSTVTSVQIDMPAGGTVAVSADA